MIEVTKQVIQTIMGTWQMGMHAYPGLTMICPLQEHTSYQAGTGYKLKIFTDQYIISQTCCKYKMQLTFTYGHCFYWIQHKIYLVCPHYLISTAATSTLAVILWTKPIYLLVIYIDLRTWSLYLCLTSATSAQLSNLLLGAFTHHLEIVRVVYSNNFALTHWVENAQHVTFKKSKEISKNRSYLLQYSHHFSKLQYCTLQHAQTSPRLLQQFRHNVLSQIVSKILLLYLWSISGPLKN